MPYATFAFNSVGLLNESLLPQMSVRYHEVRNLQTFFVDVQVYTFSKSEDRELAWRRKRGYGFGKTGKEPGNGQAKRPPFPLSPFPFFPSIPLLFLQLRLNGNNTNVYSEKCGLYGTLD